MFARQVVIFILKIQRKKKSNRIVHYGRSSSYYYSLAVLMEIVFFREITVSRMKRAGIFSCIYKLTSKNM